MKVRVFWDVALMMEAVRTSEMSVNFNVTTRRYIPQDSKLQVEGTLRDEGERQLNALISSSLA
jgi:hypothetical protein